MDKWRKLIFDDEQNASCRKTRRVETFFLYLKLLLTALSTFPNAKDNVVWRGITGETDNYEGGKKFVWWGFSSCSRNLPTVKKLLKPGPKVIFSIEFIRGVPIQSCSSFAQEEEILIPPGALMKVISSEMFEENIQIVHLKEELPVVDIVDGPFRRSQIDN